MCVQNPLYKAMYTGDAAGNQRLTDAKSLLVALLREGPRHASTLERLDTISIHLRQGIIDQLWADVLPSTRLECARRAQASVLLGPPYRASHALTLRTPLQAAPQKRARESKVCTQRAWSHDGTVD